MSIIVKIFNKGMKKFDKYDENRPSGKSQDILKSQKFNRKGAK
jgi:hypothetical protein